MLRRFFHIGLILSIILLYSCQKESVAEPDKGRVLLYYMAVDETTISFDLYEKIESVLEGAAGASCDILIYSDTDRSAPRLQQVVVSKNGSASLKTLEEFNEENSTSPIVLRRMINRMLEMYPGRQYGLVVFTHSSGWLPAGTLLNPLSVTRSIGIDDNPGSGLEGRQEMELTDFAEALHDGLFDFIVFESCLTANVEVAYELRAKTPYILASAAEIVSPGFEPLYKTHLSLLTDLKRSPELALSDFASAYYQTAKNSDKYDHSATVSLIATAHMEELAGTVGAIISAPAADLGDPDEVQYFDRYEMYQYPAHPRFFDLEDYIRRVASDQQFLAFKQVLDKTMLYCDATPTFLWRYNGFLIRSHCGLTTYIERPEYERGRINAAWRKTSWYRAIHTGQ